MVWFGNEMRFILDTFLVRDRDSKHKQQGGKQYKILQPVRYAWLREKKIPIRRLSRDSQEAICYDRWGDVELENVWFVDFYIDIPKKLLKEWNSLHNNQRVSVEDAANWPEIYEIRARRNRKGLSEWIKINLQDEYCNLGFGTLHWGFRDKDDAVLFKLAFK